MTQKALSSPRGEFLTMTLTVAGEDATDQVNVGPLRVLMGPVAPDSFKGTLQDYKVSVAQAGILSDALVMS